MGCTDSSTVVQSKPKPVFASLPHTHLHNLLLGQIQPSKYICMSILTPKSEDQPLQLIDRPLPELVCVNNNPNNNNNTNNNNNNKFKPSNYAQILRIGTSSLYVITGGINYKLDHIYTNTYLFNPKSNKIYPLPDMKQARYSHCCVYADQCVYVMGGRQFGEDNQAILRRCQKLKLNMKDIINLEQDVDVSDEKIEQYLNSSRNKLQWQQFSPMNQKRCSHISAVYNDRIYAIGGYTAQYQRSTIIEYYQYKIKQGAKWKALNVQLPFGVESCTTVLNNSNQITIFGGNTNSGPSDCVLTLNLLQGYESVHSNRKMESKKILHKLVEGQGCVYLLGGNADLQIQCYKLDSQDSEKLSTHQAKPSPKKLSNKISNTNSNINPLSKHFKCCQDFQIITQSQSTLNIPFKYQPPSSQYEKSDSDEIVYVFGTSTQPFILQLNISVPYASYIPVPLSIRLNALQGVVYLPQRKQYLIFGGISDSQEDISAQTFVYSPNSAVKYSGVVAKMTIPRYAFGYEKIGNWIYAVGGGSVDQQSQLLILNKCERIDTRTLPKPGNKLSQWVRIADLPCSLISPMTLNYKDKLYVFGGMKQDKQRNKNIFRYQQKDNLWEQLKFCFPFGLQASSIYHRKQSEYVIFGGRVVNGDTKKIWALTMINNGEDCVFEEKGEMKQAKCLHHTYKPKHQNFIVILGGHKQFLSYYDSQSLKPIESDILIGMKKLFSSSLGILSDKSLKNYTVAIKQ